MINIIYFTKIETSSATHIVFHAITLSFQFTQAAEEANTHAFAAKISFLYLKIEFGFGYFIEITIVNAAKITLRMHVIVMNTEY